MSHCSIIKRFKRWQQKVATKFRDVQASFVSISQKSTHWVVSRKDLHLPSVLKFSGCSLLKRAIDSAFEFIREYVQTSLWNDSNQQVVVFRILIKTRIAKTKRELITSKLTKNYWK